MSRQFPWAIAMNSNIAFIDTEISTVNHQVLDIGLLRGDDLRFHGNDPIRVNKLLENVRYLVGHNILEFDGKYLNRFLKRSEEFVFIDTLFLSPLLFPKKPYHKLVKDDRLESGDLNNPLNDAIRSRYLFEDEISAFNGLSDNLKQIYFELLKSTKEFSGFFEYTEFDSRPLINLTDLIRKEFDQQICHHCNLNQLVTQYPIELAYCLALINTKDTYSITPNWARHHFPKIDWVIRQLRYQPCELSCDYCREYLNVHRNLQKYFGYSNFRLYDGEPLQEQTVQAAVNGDSLLAIFPTGGGKSLTFQLPALIEGDLTGSLTVVISPLQSLMKDQVDNLRKKDLIQAVAINGLLNPIERAEAIECIADGRAKILYLSPEQLRSSTIERLLTKRLISRFVIDEAHCFSAWGHDFRVDYLYIGPFIKKLTEQNVFGNKIAVSCFTATAKQKVVADISDYFRQHLGIELKRFTSSAERKNLSYQVLNKESDEEKYKTIRDLLTQFRCPTIIYTATTDSTVKLAHKLTEDGFPALPYHGKMESEDKVNNQNRFISGDINTIVATTAFGMGVDKDNVGLVIHYDISSSLENYVQEAGRAGRDPRLTAQCYVLFCDRDLQKHFTLLNQTKLTYHEINQVWRAIKNETTKYNTRHLHCSPLELATSAGWPNNRDETRIKTAVSALEHAGLIRRLNNSPHVYATSIRSKNLMDARNMIEASSFTDAEKVAAIRIMGLLISQKNTQKNNAEAESRVDYIADNLGLERKVVVHSIQQLRNIGLLADETDLHCRVESSQPTSKLKYLTRLEHFLIDTIFSNLYELSYKKLNNIALDKNIPSSDTDIKKIIRFWRRCEWIKSDGNATTEAFVVKLNEMSVEQLIEKLNKRSKLCEYVLDYVYEKYRNNSSDSNVGSKQIAVSLKELVEYCSHHDLFGNFSSVSDDEMREALLFLNHFRLMIIDGGFMVLYQALQLERLEPNNRIQYRKSDHEYLDDYYQQKIQQIHIVGEYANLMLKNYEAAQQFVRDYFLMDYKRFIKKYFDQSRDQELKLGVSKSTYQKLFGALSEKQKSIVQDQKSQFILVAAGPGSGKTRVLVHKLASLLLLEDIKPEQLLMLTFSRVAATEFKQKLLDLVGSVAHRVDIKTFHSYSFDLLGRIGTLESSDGVVDQAIEAIERELVEKERIVKTCIVIDEAQDMDEKEFKLVETLIAHNDNIRVIAVGDDDQNIYEFRGSSSKHFQAFITQFDANLYELTENYRSQINIVAFTNRFVKTLNDRVKTKPSRAISKDSGAVILTQYKHPNFEEAIARDVAQSYIDGKTHCVLTNTNEEAALIVDCLENQGIKSKLIQSNSEFSLFDLLEIRSFAQSLKKYSSEPKISNAQWFEAKAAFKKRFSRSQNLENCLELLKIFEKHFPEKYKSDFETFVSESHFEDFYPHQSNIVYVSTIHKAKGSEFDRVYVMLDRVKTQTDEDKRKIYVALTRAKERLSIHHNLPMISSINWNGIDIDFRMDENRYQTPNKITLSLSLRDVHLDFLRLNPWNEHKKVAYQLRSGQSLFIEENSSLLKCEYEGKQYQVARFSKKFIDTLTGYHKKGYELKNAQVHFVIAWKGKESTNEVPVILPTVTIGKTVSDY